MVVRRASKTVDDAPRIALRLRSDGVLRDGAKSIAGDRDGAERDQPLAEVWPDVATPGRDGDHHCVEEDDADDVRCPLARNVPQQLQQRQFRALAAQR